MGQVTTIKISQKVKRQLDRIGHKNESYEDLIRKLLECYYKNCLDDEQIINNGGNL